LAARRRCAKGWAQATDEALPGVGRSPSACRIARAARASPSASPIPPP
jgi:hypothetical protein